MPKNETKKQVTGDELYELPNLYANNLETPISVMDAFEAVEKFDTKGMQDISGSYFKFEKQGEEHVFMVTGISTHEILNTRTQRVEPVECVDMIDKSAQTLYNGDKLFVSAVRNLQQLPAFVKAIWIDNIEGDKGRYKKIKVFSFIPPKEKQAF